MGRPSKFTQGRCTKILRAVQVGASHETAADEGGIGAATLSRWLAEGREAPEESPRGKFYLAFREAEAHPRLRALATVYEAIPDNPNLARWFLERREPGYAPPMPHAPAAPTGPVVIQLSLSDGRPLALSDTVIEVAYEQDEVPSLPDPTPIASA
jgi:hypothetical protein